MKAILSFLLVVSIFLSGCIHAYKGREPDFTLTGAAAQAEYDRFHFEDGYWFQSPVAFTMGSEYRAVPYKIESLKPIIKEVSPEAWDMYKRSRIWREVQWYSLGAAAGLLGALLIKGDGMNRDQWTGYYALLGVSIGCAFIQPIFLSRAAERYNEDLKLKFSPALGLNFGF